MNPDAPQPYRVSLSGRVFDKVRELAAVAAARGDGEAFLAALREFDRRLRVYPQFSDPLMSGQLGAQQAGQHGRAEHQVHQGVEQQQHALHGHRRPQEPGHESGRTGEQDVRVAGMRGGDANILLIPSVPNGTDTKTYNSVTLHGQANIVPTDANGLAFGRPPGQVLNIVYLTPKVASSGGFYPHGVNGQLHTSS